MEKQEFTRAAYVRYGVLVDFEGEAPKRLARALKGKHETFAAFCLRVLKRRSDEVTTFLPILPAPNKRLSALSEIGRHPALVAWSKASATRLEQAEVASEESAEVRRKLEADKKRLQQQVRDLEGQLADLKSELAGARTGLLKRDKSLTRKVCESLEELLDQDARPKLDELVRKDADCLRSACDDPDEFSKHFKEFVRRVSYWRTGNVDLQARLTEANAAIAELRRRRDVGILPST
jgi:hypothetical protein